GAHEGVVCRVRFCGARGAHRSLPATADRLRANPQPECLHVSAAPNSGLLNRGLDAFGRHGQLEQPRARAVVYRVGDHRAHEDDGRLAAALRWRVFGIDEDGLNLRHPREARQFIRIEVVVQDLAVLEMDFLGQGITESHRDATFHLNLRTFRVNHQPHVLGADHALDLNGSLLRIDLGLSYRGHPGSRIHAAGHAITAFAGGFGWGPAEALGGSFEDADHPGVAQVLEAELDRVHSRRRGHD